MLLNTLDWVIVAAFFVISLVVGLLYVRRASQSAEEYFLSGRDMSWWLLGISMVATTFAADTPLLVTNLVRDNGVAGNWVWWGFLPTGMLTVFVYAKLWRRSGLLTDLEFYELRYSGKPAAFLRGFRALYLGLVFIVIGMAAVTAAAIKISAVLFGIQPWVTIAIAAAITVIYSSLGGLRGVLVTDFVQFIMAMVGAVAAAVFAVRHPEVGGLDGLMEKLHGSEKLNFLPDFTNPSVWVPIFLIPLAVQWWASWYPGAEPGGGAYVAQRILAARNERHATGATLLFTAAHYALRPWPWIIVALASLIVFPDVASMRDAFEGLNPELIKEDTAYPAMLTLLPAGWLGLVAASLIAAYMSTISTLLNLGSSYLTNDFYVRFINRNATQRQFVTAGRVATVLLMVLSSLFALLPSDQRGYFDLIVKIGAGTGLIFILRWFWWRINAISEIVAMAVSFLVAAPFFIINLRRDALDLPSILPDWQEFLVIVGATTAAWLAATILTRPTSMETLRAFYLKTRPGGPGWARLRAEVPEANPGGARWDVPRGIVCMLLGTISVYAALFATGYWLYGEVLPAVISTVLALATALAMFFTWRGMDNLTAEERHGA